MKTIVIYGYGKTGKAIADNLRNKYKIIPIRSKTFFKKNKLQKADIIVLSAAGNIKSLRKKKFETTHQLRLAETAINKKIVKTFSKKVKNMDIPIIIVTNNSDLFTRYLKELLKRENIYSFGLILDRLRFSKILSKNIEVVGYHGLAIPLINKKKEGDYLRLIKQEDDQVLEGFYKRGISYEFVGKAFQEYFKNFEKKGKRISLNKVETELLRKVTKKLNDDYIRMLK